VAPLEIRLEVLIDVLLFGREVEVVSRITTCRDPDDDKFSNSLSTDRLTISLPATRTCSSFIRSAAFRS
jgi:hypothetical protein